MDRPTKFRLLVVGLGERNPTFIDRLMLGLAQKGIEITIASAQKPVLVEQNPVQIHWMKTPSTAGSKSVQFFRFLSLVLRYSRPRRPQIMAGLLREHPGLKEKIFALYTLLPFMQGEWDAIYFPWNTAAIGYMGLYRLGIPVIVSCRGSQINVRPHTPGQEGYLKGLAASLRGAEVVHCVSAATCRTAVTFGADQARTKVIYPAVDPDYFVPCDGKHENNRFKIITTGNLTWIKGYETALMAVRRLADEGVDAEFHIIGDGPERQRVLYTVQDLGLEKIVVLHGQLSSQAVRERLSEADVFLLASHSEGVANAALEAMSCGLPIVTTDCGGMREAVTDGVEGFVVKVRDVDEIAGALLTLSQQPELRQRMGAAGRKRVLERFTLEEQLNDWLALLNDLKSTGKEHGES